MPKKIERRNVPSDLPLIEGIPPFLSRIYQARGLKTKAELELGLKGLTGPDALKGLDEAVSILLDCVEHQKKVVVIGDFDADGATSTALAVSSLRKMGLNNCEYLVPNRFEFGYGLTPEIVDVAKKLKPDVLMTVDNGISSVEGVRRAKDHGLKVIITDHHLPGSEIPDADAIVNPNQLGCGFECKNSAGVGVVFYVMNAVSRALNLEGWFEKRQIPPVNMADYLDLVALGTVADLVPLDRNNRILVEQGLRRIRAGKCRPGILAILNVAQKKHSQINASDIGFLLGPRLNAAGRLDDMSLGIECLLAPDTVMANAYAERLDALNKERKSIEEEMKQDVEAILEQQDYSSSKLQWGMSLFEEHWHQGVIGILASRVKEKLNRPVVVFAPENDEPLEKDSILKGSARSIPGFHMRDGLDLVAKRNPDVLVKFGGHAMAAGMTIKNSNLAAFSEAFNQVVRDSLNESDLEAVYETDGTLLDSDLTIESIELLNKSGPWGQRFPEPSFDGVYRIASSRVLKNKHLKLVLASSDGMMFDAIEFNSEWVKKQLPESVHIVFRPNINEFRGRKSVQFLIDCILEQNDSVHSNV